MGRIVYHGTTGDPFYSPHAWGDTFHAGSLQSARDRVRHWVDHYSFNEKPDEEDFDVSDEHPGKVRASYHAYEIADDAPMSRRVWADPTEGPEGEAVPEHKKNRIYPYTNTVEDVGSTSYVIPRNFVGKHVKHLGVQFSEFHDLEP